MASVIEQFVSEFASSLESGIFVKLTLGNYKGAQLDLQKLLVRPLETKKGRRLYFLYRGPVRDIAKNFDFKTGVDLITKSFSEGFSSGHLFTIENDYQLDIAKNGISRLNQAKPTFTKPPTLEHNRAKLTQVDQNSFYLKALGITADNGRVRDRQQDKWRQINKFVEVLASLVDKSELKDRNQLTIVDMGSGKGYLTFAAYDYFKNTRGVDVRVTGVDTKRDLVDLCNSIAKAAEFDGLNFVVGSIAEHEIAGVDILIALHACNTATDDALYKGIIADADLIVAAPCCHHELRPQLKSPPMLRDILKHPVMLERTAETLTDGLRSLALERHGYTTKLFEFVPTEHTPKNNMLVATKTKKAANPAAIQEQIDAIFNTYGITHQTLLTRLS